MTEDLATHTKGIVQNQQELRRFEQSSLHHISQQAAHLLRVPVLHPLVEHNTAVPSKHG